MDLDRVTTKMASIKAKRQSGNPVVQRVQKNFHDPNRLRQSILMEFRNNKRDLGNSAWDVLSAIMNYLKDYHVTKNLACYSDCICELAKASSPKELYIGVLEQYDPATDFRYIEMLHPVFELILTKYVKSEPNSCALSFETTLSTMAYYLDSLNKPEYQSFNPPEPLEKVYENLKCLKYIERTLDLIRPAVTCMLLQRRELKKIDRFISFCLQFACHLSMKLARLDTDIATPINKGEKKNEKSQLVGHTPSHVVVHDVFGLKLQLYSVVFLYNCPDWVVLHPRDSFATPDGMPEITRQILRGRGGFLYYVFCRGIHYDKFPKVYSSTGLLSRTLCAINALLTWEFPIVIWKGLELLSYVVQRTAKSGISCDEVLYYISLDYSANVYVNKPKGSIRDLLENLRTITLDIPPIAIRRRACKLITQVIDMFYWRDKILLLTYILRTFKESRMVGVIIGFLKDKLNEVLRDNPPEGSEVFCNQKRMKMVGGMIFYLPDGADTDLLPNYDKIMAALNLLRFLLIRDKKNRTGLFDNLAVIQKTYVEAIRTNVELTCQLYASQIRAYHKKSKMDPEARTELSGLMQECGESSLPGLTCEDSAKELQAALQTLTVMGTVAARVEELIDEMKKPADTGNTELVGNEKDVSE